MRVVDFRPRNYALEAAGAKPKRKGQFVATRAPINYFRLEALTLQGFTTRGIAARLRCPQAHVCRELQRHGLTTVAGGLRRAREIAREAGNATR